MSSVLHIQNTPCEVFVSDKREHTSSVIIKTCSEFSIKTPRLSPYFFIACSVINASVIHIPCIDASQQSLCPSRVKSPSLFLKEESAVSFAKYLILGLFLLVIVSILIRKTRTVSALRQSRNVKNNYLRAAFAVSVRAVNAAGSAIAISESIFLLRVTPAFLRPFMKVE